MSEVSVFLEAVQHLRDDMQQLHGRQSERYDTLRKDMNSGFDFIRSEMKLQNGRVNALEIRATGNEEKAVPVHRSVYAFIGVVLLAVIAAIVTMVLKP